MHFHFFLERLVNVQDMYKRSALFANGWLYWICHWLHVAPQMVQVGAPTSAVSHLLCSIASLSLFLWIFFYVCRILPLLSKNLCFENSSCQLMAQHISCALSGASFAPWETWCWCLGVDSKWVHVLVWFLSTLYMLYTFDIIYRKRKYALYAILKYKICGWHCKTNFYSIMKEIR